MALPCIFLTHFFLLSIYDLAQWILLCPLSSSPPVLILPVLFGGLEPQQGPK